MDGYFFAFLTAILAATAAIIQKKVLKNEHASEFVAVFAIINLVICIPLFFYIDYSTITFFGLVVVYLASLLGSAAFYLIAISIRHSEISAISPLLVLGPGISALLGLGLLGEVLRVHQWFGILILILGAYVLESHKHEGILDPLKYLIKAKFTKYVLLALILYGFSSVLDKIIITSRGLSPLSYTAFVHLFIAINYFIFISVKYSPKEIMIGFKDAKWVILIVSFATLGYRFSSLLAIKQLEIGVVSAIKRLSAVLIVLIGGEIFHEHNLKRKIIACVIMVFGAVLIVV